MHPVHGGHYLMRPIYRVYQLIHLLILKDYKSEMIVSFWCHFLLWWCCAHLGPAWDKFVENPVWCRGSGRDGVYRRTCRKQTSLTFNFFIQHIHCLCILYIKQQKINKVYKLSLGEWRTEYALDRICTDAATTVRKKVSWTKITKALCVCSTKCVLAVCSTKCVLAQLCCVRGT